MRKRVKDSNQLYEEVIQNSKRMGYEFLGFVEETSHILSTSKIKLVCKEKHKWSTGTLTSLKLSLNCPICSRLQTRKSSEEEINKFFETGKFHKDTVFTKTGLSSTGKSWEYICPTCSNDEYVRADLCSGVFKSTSTNLMNGSLACRCSGKYRWTKEQREYKVNNLLEKDTRYRFLGWNEKYKNLFTLMKMSCIDHGDFVCSVGNFINSSTRCPKCAGRFSLSSEADLYVLVVEGCTSSFLGYGISGEIDRRLALHTRNVKDHGFSITGQYTFPFKRDKAHQIEQAIKVAFPRNPQEIEGFKTEATFTQYLNQLLDFIKDNS